MPTMEPVTILFNHCRVLVEVVGDEPVVSLDAVRAESRSRESDAFD